MYIINAPCVYIYVWCALCILIFSIYILKVFYIPETIIEFLMIVWYSTRWWFQIFVIFTPTWGNDPIWRAYFSDGLKFSTSQWYWKSQFRSGIPILHRFLQVRRCLEVLHNSPRDSNRGAKKGLAMDDGFWMMMDDEPKTSTRWKSLFFLFFSNIPWTEFSVQGSFGSSKTQPAGGIRTLREDEILSHLQQEFISGGMIRYDRLWFGMFAKTWNLVAIWFRFWNCFVFREVSNSLLYILCMWEWL